MISFKYSKTSADKNPLWIDTQ